MRAMIVATRTARRAPRVARMLSTPAPVEPLDEVAAVKQMDKVLENNTKTVTPYYRAAITLPAQHLPEKISEVGALEPAMPAEQKKRTVIISQKARSSMTSGLHATHAWHVTWPNEKRWGNPLMGWTSTADPLSNMDMRFETIADATFFCEKHGLKYEVEGTPVVDKTFDKVGTNKYAHNFLSRAKENTLARFGKKQTIFSHENGNNRSSYFRPLRYHGEREVDQYGPNPDSGYGHVPKKE